MAHMAGSGEIVFYQRDNGSPGIDVRMDGSMTQRQRRMGFFLPIMVELTEMLPSFLSREIQNGQNYLLHTESELPRHNNRSSRKAARRANSQRSYQADQRGVD
jgi:hypothetical protein